MNRHVEWACSEVLCQWGWSNILGKIKKKSLNFILDSYSVDKRRVKGGEM